MKYLFLIINLFIFGYESKSSSAQTTEKLKTSNLIKIIKNVKIEEVPEEFREYEEQGYNRYVGYQAPNGKNIHLLIMNRISDYQIIKSYNVLSHYLKPNIESPMGGIIQKELIANSMANNNAILKLVNYRDEPKYNDDLPGQPLFEEEIQVEGGNWYMSQNYEHRDASYEEILHLVHDYGIGVLNADNNIKGALPKFQLELNYYQKLALRNSWMPPEDIIYEWTSDENSIDQEYLASVIDAYYGLWGARNEPTESGRSMWGMYKIKTREDFYKKPSIDNAYLLVEKIFHKYLTYNAYLSDSLKGEFSLKFDPSKPYTNHSRYLKDITITGNNYVSVIVNELDNNITGNGSKTTVIFNGEQNGYNITYNLKNPQKEIIVKDIDPSDGDDGINILNNINSIAFKDDRS